MADVVSRLKSYTRNHLKPIDLRDAFQTDMRDLIMPERSRNFKVYSSSDDYNREISSIFHAHGAAFYIDRTHHDGHFRV